MVAGYFPHCTAVKLGGARKATMEGVRCHPHLLRHPATLGKWRDGSGHGKAHAPRHVC